MTPECEIGVWETVLEQILRLNHRNYCCWLYFLKLRADFLDTDNNKCPSPHSQVLRRLPSSSLMEKESCLDCLLCAHPGLSSFPYLCHTPNSLPIPPSLSYSWFPSFPFLIIGTESRPFNTPWSHFWVGLSDYCFSIFSLLKLSSSFHMPP